MSDATPEKDPVLSLLRRAPGKRPLFLENGGNDHLFAMIVELATQLSVLRERLFVHESLGARGIPVDAASVEAWRPSEKEDAELIELRRRQLSELFRTVISEPPNDNAPADTEDPSPPK